MPIRLKFLFKEPERLKFSKLLSNLINPDKLKKFFESKLISESFKISLEL